MIRYFFIAGCLSILPNIAAAYIDPASGSAILAAILGGCVATSIFFKSLWYKARSLFAGGKSSACPKTDQNESDRQVQSTNNDM